MAIISDFNALSDGNLATQDGWTDEGGAFQITVASGDPPAYGGSGKGVNATDSSASDSARYIKTITALTADNDVISFWIRATAATGSGGFMVFTDSTTTGNKVIGSIGLYGASNAQIRGDANTNIVVGYSANTWYNVQIRFDFTQNKMQGRAAAGAYATGSWSTLQVTEGAKNISQCDGIKIYMGGDNSGNTYYLDLIESNPVVVSGPANMKTWNGLASASVKTINGLAIASVKTVNGLA